MTTAPRRRHAARLNPGGQSARSIINWYWSRRLTMTIDAPPAATLPGIAR